MSEAFDFAASIYSGGLASKADEEGISSLNVEQKNVVLAWWAKGEIDNGGFELLYSQPLDVDAVIESFSAIGANSYADACNRSKELFLGGNPPNDLFERIEEVKLIMNSDADDPWLSLNKIVWADSDKFDDLVSEYIKKNIEHFSVWLHDRTADESHGDV